MFDSLKNMAGLAGLMKDLPRIKARLEEVKEHLAAATVTAETGGGAVRVTASGMQKIVSIDIEPALFTGLVDASDPDDRALGAQLITGAVNAALDKAKALAEREFADAASELGVPLPPGGLGGMLT